jgi:hypothetical protein
MDYMSEFEPTTFAQDMETMRTRLIGMGAGECAVQGTVVDTDTGASFRAMYDVINEPPSVVQLAYSGQGHFTVTRVGVDPENDTPLVDFGRYDPNGIEDLSVLHLMGVEMGTENLRRFPETPARMFFDQTFDNVQAFEPDSL